MIITKRFLLSCYPTHLFCLHFYFVTLQIGFIFLCFATSKQVQSYMYHLHYEQFVTMNLPWKDFFKQKPNFFFFWLKNIPNHYTQHTPLRHNNSHYNSNDLIWSSILITLSSALRTTRKKPINFFMFYFTNQ